MLIYYVDIKYILYIICSYSIYCIQQNCLDRSSNNQWIYVTVWQCVTVYHTYIVIKSVDKYSIFLINAIQTGKKWLASVSEKGSGIVDLFVLTWYCRIFISFQSVMILSNVIHLFINNVNAINTIAYINIPFPNLNLGMKSEISWQN